MKVSLFVIGFVLAALLMTLFGPTESTLQKEDLTHSRIDRYIDDAIRLYSKTQSNIGEIRGVKSLSPDGRYGLVGLDPWGQPYEYFIEDKNDSSLLITLWSKGSDLRSKLKAVNFKNMQELKNKGDDYIISKEVRI